MLRRSSSFLRRLIRIMSKPTVTAVLPTFNRGPRLGVAVGSVLAQTFEDFELLIIDDASDESDRPDPSEFTDQRVRVIQRDTNGGVAAAQNTGLQAARGDLVAFLHSDDTWEPGKLAIQVDAMRSAPDALAIESATIRISDGGTKTVGPRLNGATFDQFFSRTVRNVHIAGFMFRREALIDVGGFDERLRSYEDFDVLLRLLRAGTFVFSEDPVATLDQRGEDRLGESPWMAKARCTLLELYDTELIGRYGGLPDNWRDWSVQLAVEALENGDGAEARVHLRRVGRGRRVEWVKRSPLWAASYLGDAAGASIAQVTRRAWSR
jgi:glycosyltransferase involved in cell wall biosynthesis